MAAFGRGIGEGFDISMWGRAHAGSGGTYRSQRSKACSARVEAEDNLRRELLRHSMRSHRRLVCDSNLRKVSSAAQRHVTGRKKLSAHRDGGVWRCLNKRQGIVKKVADRMPRGWCDTEVGGCR